MDMIGFFSLGKQTQQLALHQATNRAGAAVASIISAAAAATTVAAVAPVVAIASVT